MQQTTPFFHSLLISCSVTPVAVLFGPPRQPVSAACFLHSVLSPGIFDRFRSFLGGCTVQKAEVATRDPNFYSQSALPQGVLSWRYACLQFGRLTAQP